MTSVYRPAINSMYIGFDAPTVIVFKKPVTRAEANFLHILGEFPNRWVPIRDVCDRLNTNPVGVRIQACRVRKCLTGDWDIQGGYNNEYRLLDLRDR
jgi:hypothetical protein